tara:strand:+ start:571 stop:1134 length:564 start_codon:yes stop_codon:yes gene_type:complete
MTDNQRQKLLFEAGMSDGLVALAGLKDEAQTLYIKWLDAKKELDEASEMFATAGREFDQVESDFRAVLADIEERKRMVLDLGFTVPVSFAEDTPLRVKKKNKPRGGRAKVFRDRKVRKLLYNVCNWKLPNQALSNIWGIPAGSFSSVRSQLRKPRPQWGKNGSGPEFREMVAHERKVYQEFVDKNGI